MAGEGGDAVPLGSCSGVLGTSEGGSELLVAPQRLASLGSADNMCMANAAASCSLLLSLTFASDAHREGNRGSTRIVLFGAVAFLLQFQPQRLQSGSVE